MKMRIQKILGGGYSCLLLIVFMAVQLTLVFFAQKKTIINMDGIFSYTLANNPYHYVFIDATYPEFPENNGWIDARILKENYVAQTYDRFNYAAVYHHQQYDVHPPLYYAAVHTISSLFPGTYSNMFTLSINLFALFLADIILVRLFKLLYGSGGYAIVPMVLLMAMESMRFLLTWARMYMLLFAFCLWYLYLHAKLLKKQWQKRDLLLLAVCIFLGTLTHYYFYVYAGMLTVLAIVYLIWRRKGRELLRYLYAGVAGILASWIFYPWVLFHIFLNEQQKHTQLEGWALEKGKAYVAFLGKALLNGRIWGFALLAAAWIIGIFLSQKAEEKEPEGWKRVFRRMTMGSGLLYSLLIYTLDGDVLYYSTALYMAFIVWASMILLDLSASIFVPWGKGAVRIGVAVIGVGVLCSGTVMGQYMSEAQNVAGNMYRGQPLTGTFYRLPELYQNYNCLYIEVEPDGLLHNYWFAFGEYRRFKKMSLEEFALHGIRQEDLLGCEGGEGIVVYAPSECELDEKTYRRIAGDGSYEVYEYAGGEF